jgi:hypothetical protein
MPYLQIRSTTTANPAIQPRITTHCATKPQSTAVVLSLEPEPGAVAGAADQRDMRDQTRRAALGRDVVG